MEKILIVYASVHQGNTRKLVDGVGETYEITKLDAGNRQQADLSGYDLIGFASGIDFGRFYEPVVRFLRQNLPAGKRVFFLYTCARPRERFVKEIQAEAEKRHAAVLGSFGCKGFNTYGPWKLVGGMNRNHPSEAEIAEAVAFLGSLLSHPQSNRDREENRKSQGA